MKKVSPYRGCAAIVRTMEHPAKAGTKIPAAHTGKNLAAVGKTGGSRIRIYKSNKGGYSMDRLFAVLNTAGNIVARGPAECAPDASLIKGGQYRLKFFEGEKGRADMEAIIEKQRRKVMKT